MAKKRIKYLGTKFIKEVKDLFTETIRLYWNKLNRTKVSAGIIRIQWFPSQNLKVFKIRNGNISHNIHMELKGTANSQKNLGKEQI